MFKNEIDWNGYFLFPKSFISSLTWAEMSTAAKAVYPAIGSHFNRHGEFFPSEKRLAALSGVTVKTA